MDVEPEAWADVTHAGLRGSDRPGRDRSGVVTLKFRGSPATVLIDAPAHSRRPASSVKSRPASSALASASRRSWARHACGVCASASSSRGSVPDDRAVSYAFHRVDERQDRDGGIGTRSHGFDDRREQHGRRERASGVVHDDRRRRRHRPHPSPTRPIADGFASGDHDDRPDERGARLANLRLEAWRRCDDHGGDHRRGEGPLDGDEHQGPATDREERLGNLASQASPDPAATTTATTRTSSMRGSMPDGRGAGAERVELEGYASTSASAANTIRPVVVWITFVTRTSTCVPI